MAVEVTKKASTFVEALDVAIASLQALRELNSTVDSQSFSVAAQAVRIDVRPCLREGDYHVYSDLQTFTTSEVEQAKQQLAENDAAEVAAAGKLH